MPAFQIRSATDDDRRFLALMLYEAAHWRQAGDRPPVDEALRRPELSRYVAGWGREGDRGLVATDDGEPVGAAWYRLFSADEPGYGFVDAAVPELALAVTATRRRLGVGRAVLAALVVQAQLDGHLAVSLSVEEDNPARRLCDQLGFEPVDRGDAAVTMLLRFGLR